MSQKVTVDGIGDAMKQAFKKFGTVTTEDVSVAATYAAKEALQTLRDTTPTSLGRANISAASQLKPRTGIPTHTVCASVRAVLTTGLRTYLKKATASEAAAEKPAVIRT